MGNRLKELRQALGMTQQEFADKLGVSRNNIASYETNKCNLGDSVIALIVKTFSVSDSWLRTGEGEMFREVTKDERIAEFMGSVLKQEPDSFRVRFISMLSRLDESDWAVLEKMALAMYEEKKKD